MADALSQLFVTLSLETKPFINGVRDAQREGRALEKVFAPLSRLSRDVGAAMGAVGNAMTVGVTLPLVALGGAAVKFGSEFQDSMTQSIAIMGDVSDAMKTDLGNAAKEMAKTTVFSAKEGADALFFLASSGLTATESMKALPVVAKFAQAGVLGLAQSSEFLTDAQSALGLKTNDAIQNMENMKRVADVLVKANILANATTQQFAEALTNKAAAALRLVNKDIEEGTAVLAAFASQGVKGTEAGEQLAIVMRDLQSKAIKSPEIFKQLNVSVFDASGNMRNMADIVGDLEKLMTGLSDEQKKATLTMLGFQDRSVGAMLQLIGTSDAIRGYEKALRSAGGATDEIAKKQMESFKNQMKLVQHQIELLGITLFEALAPVLTTTVLPVLQKAANALQKMAEAFGRLPRPVQAGAIAFLALAASIGPALKVGEFFLGWLSGVIPLASRLIPLLFGPAGLSGAFAALGIAAKSAPLVALPGEVLALSAASATAATTTGVLAAKTGLLAGTLGTLGTVASGLSIALIAVGAAFIGWKLANVVVDALGVRKEFDNLKSATLDLARSALLATKSFLLFSTRFAVDQLSNLAQGARDAIRPLDPLIGKLKELLAASLAMHFKWAERDIRSVTEWLDELAVSMDHTGASAKKLADTPLGKSSNDLAAAMARVKAESDKTKTGLDALDPATRAHIQAIQDQIDALTKGEKKLSDFQQQVKSFVDSVKKDADESRALATAIKQLEAAHVPAAAIVEALGKNIAESTAKMIAHKTQVDAVVLKYNELVEKGETVKRQQEVLGDNARNVNAAFLDQSIKLNAMNFFYAKYQEQLEKTGDLASQMRIEQIRLNDTLAETSRIRLLDPSFLPSIPHIPIPEPNTAPLPMPPNLPIGVGVATEKALRDLDRLKAVPSEVAQKILEMQNALKGAGTAAQINGEIIAVMGDEILQAGAAAKQFGIPLDANTRSLLKQVEAANRSKQVAEEWRRAWATAAGNVASSFADSVVSLFSRNKQDVENIQNQITDLQRAKERDRLQLLIDNTKKGTTARKNAELQMAAFEKQVQQEQNRARDGQIAKLQASLDAQTNLLKRFATSVKDIFAELGKSLLKLGLTKFFTEIASKISGLFGSKGGGIGDLISNALGASKTGGIKDLAKQFTPQAIKAALGIGATAAITSGTAIAGTAGTTALAAGSTAGALGLGAFAAPTAVGGIAGTTAAGTAAAGTAGGLGATVTALATNPITIAAAAAIVGGLLVKKFVGEGRKTANEFVNAEQGQNAFGRSLANIVDPLSRMRTAGTETLKDATAAKTAITKLWDDFQKAAQEFASKGKNQAKVVGQAFETLRPIVNNLLGDIEKDVARLGGDTKGGGTIVGNGRAGPGLQSSLDLSNLGVGSKVPAKDTRPAVIVQSPQFNLNVQIDGSELTPLAIRDKVAPELTLLLDTGGRGLRERWQQILGANDSPGTATPVGI